MYRGMIVNFRVKKFKLIVSLFLIFTLFCSSSCQLTDKPISEVEQYTSNSSFSMPFLTLPVFPDYSVNIKDFGAKANGDTDNTLSINRAIQACKAGRGKVIIPAGIWATELI